MKCDSPSAAYAARWYTTSNFSVAMSSETKVVFLRSPTIKRTVSVRFFRNPPDRSSTATTSKPSWAQSLATCDPIKPAAPVTSAFQPMFARACITAPKATFLSSKKSLHIVLIVFASQKMQAKTPPAENRRETRRVFLLHNQVQLLCLRIMLSSCTYRTRGERCDRILPGL